MPKSTLRILLILWAILLIAQFLLAAYLVYAEMSQGMPWQKALFGLPPIMAVASLALFLLMYVQYRRRP